MDSSYKRNLGVVASVGTGDKIGVYNRKYYISHSNLSRYWYSEDRKKTVEELSRFYNELLDYLDNYPEETSSDNESENEDETDRNEETDGKDEDEDKDEHNEVEEEKLTGFEELLDMTNQSLNGLNNLKYTYDEDGEIIEKLDNLMVRVRSELKRIREKTTAVDETIVIRHGHRIHNHTDNCIYCSLMDHASLISGLVRSITDL